VTLEEGYIAGVADADKEAVGDAHSCGDGTSADGSDARLTVRANGVD
jgi:hypothetical protein